MKTSTVPTEDLKAVLHKTDSGQARERLEVILNEETGIMNVKLLREGAQLPNRKFPSAGYDLYAPSEHRLLPGEPHKVPLGIAMELPNSHVGIIKDRSSMGAKGITVLGGVIDEDYRGEVMVVLLNTTNQVYAINEGDRIAQLVVLPSPWFEVKEVDKLNETVRGKGGFGSTGK